MVDSLGHDISNEVLSLYYVPYSHRDFMLDIAGNEDLHSELSTIGRTAYYLATVGDLDEKSFIRKSGEAIEYSDVDEDQKELAWAVLGALGLSKLMESGRGTISRQMAWNKALFINGLDTYFEEVRNG